MSENLPERPGDHNSGSTESPSVHFVFSDLEAAGELQEADAESPAESPPGLQPALSPSVDVGSRFRLSDLEAMGDLESVADIESTAPVEEAAGAADASSGRSLDLRNRAKPHPLNPAEGDVPATGRRPQKKRNAAKKAAEAPIPDPASTASPTTTPPRASQPVAAVVQSAPDVPHDVALESSVRQALEKGGLPSVRQIIILAKNSTVTLSGTASSPAEKERALDLARRTAGVGKIFDLIHVAEAAEPIPTPPATVQGAPPPRVQTAFPQAAPAQPSFPQSASVPAYAAPAAPTRYVAPKTRRSFGNPFSGFENPFGGREMPFGWRPAAGAVVGLGVLAWFLMGGFGGGNSHRVTGKVLFEGKPAAGATVRLYPKDPVLAKNIRVTATAAADGSFSLGTNGIDDGAPAGDYIATIALYTPGTGTNLLPGDFSTPQLSKLSVTLPNSAASLAPLEFTKTEGPTSVTLLTP